MKLTGVGFPTLVGRKGTKMFKELADHKGFLVYFKDKTLANYDRGWEVAIESLYQCDVDKVTDEQLLLIVSRLIDNHLDDISHLMMFVVDDTWYIKKSVHFKGDPQGIELLEVVLRLTGKKIVGDYVTGVVEIQHAVDVDPQPDDMDTDIDLLGGDNA